MTTAEDIAAEIMAKKTRRSRVNRHATDETRDWGVVAVERERTCRCHGEPMTTWRNPDDGREELWCPRVDPDYVHMRVAHGVNSSEEAQRVADYLRAYEARLASM